MTWAGERERERRERFTQTESDSVSVLPGTLMAGVTGRSEGEGDTRLRTVDLESSRRPPSGRVTKPHWNEKVFHFRYEIEEIFGDFVST